MKLISVVEPSIDTLPVVFKLTSFEMIPPFENEMARLFPVSESVNVEMYTDSSKVVVVAVPIES